MSIIEKHFGNPLTFLAQPISCDNCGEDLKKFERVIINKPRCAGKTEAISKLPAFCCSECYLQYLENQRNIVINRECKRIREQTYTDTVSEIYKSKQQNG